MADIEGPAEPGVVNPALIAQLGAANGAYLTAKQNTVKAYEAMQRTMLAYRNAAVNVREVPGSETQDPDTQETVKTGATTQGQGLADAEKIAYEAAQAAYEQAQATEVTWLQEVARITDAVVVEEGRSPEERAAIAQAFTEQVEASGLNLEAARTQNALDAITLQIAQAEQAADTPEKRAALELLTKQLGDADLAHKAASTNSLNASAASTAAQTVTENALRPHLVKEAAASADLATSEATLKAAEARHADQLAQANADLQQKNVTWQEYQNRLANIDLEFKTALLAGGMPQIEIDQALATLKGTDIANQQMSEGDLVTKLTQMRDAIAAGTMTEQQGDEAAEELFSGATQFERQQQVDSNTQTAINQAATGGYLVGPNQKTTDPYGFLGPALEAIGLPGKPQDISPQSVPAWLEGTGQMSTADARKTFAPGGKFYGENGLPAWADASQGLDIGPEDWAAMQGEQAVQAATAVAEEAAAVPPPAETAPAGTTGNTINITLGGGASAPVAPPSDIEARMAKEAAVRAANTATAPPGGGGAPSSPGPPLPAAPPASVPPPTVGPKTNPGPPAPTAPEPWGKPTGSQGMQKFGPQPPLPAQSPRWLRSAQFAGGR